MPPAALAALRVGDATQRKLNEFLRVLAPKPRKNAAGEDDPEDLELNPPVPRTLLFSSSQASGASSSQDPSSSAPPAGSSAAPTFTTEVVDPLATAEAPPEEEIPADDVAVKPTKAKVASAAKPVSAFTDISPYLEWFNVAKWNGYDAAQRAVLEPKDLNTKHISKWTDHASGTIFWTQEHLVKDPHLPVTAIIVTRTHYDFPRVRMDSTLDVVRQLYHYAIIDCEYVKVASVRQQADPDFVNLRRMLEVALDAHAKNVLVFVGTGCRGAKARRCMRDTTGILTKRRGGASHAAGVQLIQLSVLTKLISSVF